MDFADIQLIECNRSQSIQGKNNNDEQPAIFTCKLGQGVKLDAGDTVEILNAFVSEDGCGGENIEFIGDFIYTDNGFDEEGNPSEIVKQNLEYTKLNIVTDKTNVRDFQHRASVVVNNENNEKKNTNEKKELKDNETYVQQRYYKTNNGEGCLYQPRRFIIGFEGGNKFATASSGGADPDPALMFPMITFFEKKDDEDQGVGFLKIKKNYSFKVADCDYFLYTSGGPNEFWNGFDSAGGEYSYTTTEQWYRPRTDNKRFTMFMRDQNYKIRNLAPQVPNPFNSVGADLNWIDAQILVNDYIAFANYVEYIELKHLKVDAGFTPATNIAAQITEQLQQNVDYTTSEGDLIVQPETLYWKHEFGVSEQNYEIFTARTTETYFPIESGGMGRNDQSAWLEVTGAHDKLVADPYADNLSIGEKQYSMDYLSTTQYIFVKRPEMFIAGRKLHDYFSNITTNPSAVVGINQPSYIVNQVVKGTPNTPLITSFEWTDENLKMLSDLFKAQEPYSVELEMYDDRFLHMNCIPVISSGSTVLGTDGFENDTSINKEFYTSAPIRFKYDKSKEDIYNDGMLGTNDLCYGFATRNVGTTLSTGQTYDTIVLHPELATSITGGGWNIPELYDGFTGATTILANSTILGWDKHAMSYGQVIMSSLNGYALGPPESLIDKNGGQSSDTVNTACDYAIQNKTPTTDTESKWTNNFQRITDLLNFRYIGANNPSLEYNALTGTFGFKSLHTAENVNQPSDAGRVTTVKIAATPTEPAQSIQTEVPISAQAATECYKINKRLRYNDYTPDMKPYWVSYPKKLVYIAGRPPEYLPVNMSLLERGGAFEATVDDAPTSIAVANQNIEDGVLFDAHCGIFLDIGNTCPERYWKKSFWGLLGFTYEQFHPKTSTILNNEQIRVGEDTMFSMKYVTTNCQVVVSDLKDYPIQAWGGINYSTQLAPPLCVQHSNEDVKLGYGMKYKPYIIQNTQSITTRAQRIPKLMTRPYYTIRSDILDATKYVGGNSGGIKLSVLGVVDKMNGDGDYYFTENAGMAFTITNPITLTDITTAICNPNGRLANVNDNSAVIYKITKQMNTSKFDIVNQILQEQQSKK